MSWASGPGSDVNCPHCRSDVEALKRELQVLSEQYSQKCLEIGALTLQAEEREHTLRCCQQEGQELQRHNQVGPAQGLWRVEKGESPTPTYTH